MSERVTWESTDGLVFSDWTDRFVAVLRKVSGHAYPKKPKWLLNGRAGGWELVVRR